jgi:hypothetical protein
MLSKKRNNVVGIATVYGLDDLDVGVRVLVEARILLFYIVKTGSRAHPTPYPMDNAGYFPRSKRYEFEADYSPTTSTEVKKTWIYTSILHGAVFN